MLGHLFIFLLFILLLTLVGGDVRHVSLSSPPTVVVEYPGDNSTVTGPRLPLRLALEVERWCGADGDGDDTGADCTPLADLVICVWAGNARQQCLPLLSALQQPGALDLSTAHMPVGTFDLSVWLYASSNSSSHPSTGRHVLVRGRAPPSSEGGDATPRTPPLPPPNEVRLHRPAPWDAARAEALTQLLPIDTSIPRRGDWQRQRSEGDEHGVERESETTTRGLRLGLLRHGPLLFNVQDFPAGISLDLQGEWEESVVRLLASALRPGDLVVDVGAHLGSFTVPLAKKVGRGRVLSLEPQQDLFQALNANLARWQPDRTVRLNLADVLQRELPAPPSAAGAGTNAAAAAEAYATECAICYSYELDGAVPESACDACSKPFHKACLGEWLRALPTTQQSFNRKPSSPRPKCMRLRAS